MLTIEKVKSGSPIVLIAFGETTEGRILQVDDDSNSIVYESGGNQETILLEVDTSVGGAYYEFAKHSETDTVFAYFKGWHSDKYVRY